MVIRDVVEADRLMTATEVAARFRVSAKTVARWVHDGKLEIAFRTPGGHMRFREATIRAFLDAQGR